MTIRKFFLFIVILLFQEVIFAERININSDWEMDPNGMSAVQADMPCFYIWNEDFCDYMEEYPADPDRYRIFRGYADVTYRKTLNPPDLESYERLFLHFEAVNFLCDIYINDVLVSSHLGGYIPFEVDITDALSGTGTDLLEVEVLYNDARMMEVRPAGSYPQIGIGYYGHLWHMGIIGNVDLIVRPYVYIHDIYVQTSVENDEIGVDVSVVNAGQSSVQVTVQTKVMHESSNIFSFSDQTIQISANDTTTFHLDETWLNPTLWTPDNPWLYKIHASFTVNPNISHVKTQIFGFREFKIDGTHYTLNGVRTNLRGDNIVIDTEFSHFPYLEPDSLNWSVSLDSMLALNFNAIRFHHAPAPDWMIRLCDQKGMMVVDESAIYGAQLPLSQTYVNNNIHWLPEWIKRDRNHPSVVIWSAVNEKLNPDQLLTVDQFVQIRNAIQALDLEHPILFEGDHDAFGRGNIYSYHYPYGWLNHQFPTLGIYDITDKIHDVKPTSWGEFEWSRGPDSENLTRDEWVFMQSLKTRVARILEVADIRAYRLDWAWFPNPEFSPGLYEFTPTSGQIEFLAKSCHPVAAFDKAYYEYSADPTLPQFNENSDGTRRFVFFNDEIANNVVQVQWQTLFNDAIFDSGSFNISIEMGEKFERLVTFKAPIVPGNNDFFLKMMTYKNGQKKFEDLIKYRSIDTGVALPGIAQNITLQANGDFLSIDWSDVTKNQEGNNINIDYYELYRSRSPEFPQSATTTISPVNSSNYTDTMSGVIGDTLLHYFYKIRAVDNGLTSESEVYGEFDMQLVTTEKTDFNLITIPLVVNDSYDTASEFMNFFPNCNSIAIWDASQQGFIQYPSLTSNTNFELNPGDPCFVNVTKDSLFTFFGKAVSASYNLTDASPTAWNLIMLPFEKIDLEDAADLYNDIPNCDGVALWNNRDQAFEFQYSPGNPQNNFDVHTGSPYWVHVTANVSWPDAGAPQKSLPKVLISDERRKVPHLVFGDLNPAFRHVTHYQAELNHSGQYLNESSSGCGLNENKWWVQCGNLKTGWKAGDTLFVRYFDGFSNYLGETVHVLDNDPAEKVTFEETSVYAANTNLDQYQILKNYPNPFNSMTTIQYFVEVEGRVEIAVYNIQGQKVRTLLQRDHVPGQYLVDWNARNDAGNSVETGVYFIHLNQNNQRLYKKVLLIK